MGPTEGEEPDRRARGADQATRRPLSEEPQHTPVAGPLRRGRQAISEFPPTTAGFRASSDALNTSRTSRNRANLVLPATPTHREDHTDSEHQQRLPVGHLGHAHSDRDGDQPAEQQTDQQPDGSKPDFPLEPAAATGAVSTSSVVVVAVIVISDPAAGQPGNATSPQAQPGIGASRPTGDRMPALRRHTR